MLQHRRGGLPHLQGWAPLAGASDRAVFRKACRAGLCSSVYARPQRALPRPTLGPAPLATRSLVCSNCFPEKRPSVSHSTHTQPSPTPSTKT